MIRDLETLISIRWLSIKFLTFSFIQISLSFPFIILFWLGINLKAFMAILKNYVQLGGKITRQTELMWIDLWMS